ncbi:hypothetical protein LshimejAT787_2000680 [Lyophyllum shimeji]|uniref:Uncharacterized protein n=1 Tax=Lyophyllum shimeji TaxID=47721 RepID=A0A9P3Q043_LYOSH|nr:hypothetical protein LshimejAT787_2000680 [Lyophyllum shimeji]
MSASTLQRSIVEGKAIRNKAAKEKSPLFNTAPSRIERNHLQFYGFALNEAWIMEYARANLTGVSDQNYWCILTWVMDHLERVTNHHDINVQPAKIDDETPANATVYEGPTGSLGGGRTRNLSNIITNSSLGPYGSCNKCCESFFLLTNFQHITRRILTHSFLCSSVSLHIFSHLYY